MAWLHRSPIFGNPIGADLHCAPPNVGSSVPAKLAVVGEVARPLGAGRWSPNVIALAEPSGMNASDFWVMSPAACVRLNVKVLTEPTIPIAQMIASMNRAFVAAGLSIAQASFETLDIPDLNVIDIGECFRGAPTAEVTQLFGNRNSVGSDDLVVYFVLATMPASNGCAAHPFGQPGVIVAQIASQWTLAHEIGHVLGLNHFPRGTCLPADCPPTAPAPTRLMTCCGTGTITVATPTITTNEANTMQSSGLVNNC